MMMLTEPIGERLKWFKESCFQISDQQVVVREDSKGGEATLICNVSNFAIAFTVEKHVPPFLRNRNPKHWNNEDSSIQCADGIILERLPDETWQLHIIECKKSVKDSTKWDQIKQQFEAALLNSLSITGILGIVISKVKCYTACRIDTLSDWVFTTSSSGKSGIGEEVSLNSAYDWTEDRINVLSLSVEHQKISLDEEGKGEIKLV